MRETGFMRQTTYALLCARASKVLHAESLAFHSMKFIEVISSVTLCYFFDDVKVANAKCRHEQSGELVAIISFAGHSRLFTRTPDRKSNSNDQISKETHLNITSGSTIS